MNTYFTIIDTDYTRDFILALSDLALKIVHEDSIPDFGVYTVTGSEFNIRLLDRYLKGEYTI